MSGYQITHLFNEGFYGGEGGTEIVRTIVPYKIMIGKNMILGQWTFNDPDELGVDSSGWNNNGESYGVTPARPLEAGGHNSAYFDGGSYIYINNSESLRHSTTSFYLSFWFRPEANGTIIASGSRWGLSYEDGEIHAYIEDRFGTRREGVLATGVLTEVTYYIVAVFDRDVGFTSCYVNTVEQHGFNIQGLKKLAPFDGAEIGRGPGPSNYLTGYIDNLNILFGVPDPADMRANYRRGTITQDYEELVNASSPALFLGFDIEDDDLVTHDISMGRYNIVDNMNVSGFVEQRSPLWSGEYLGVRLIHSGYVTIEPRQVNLPADEDEPESDLTEPEPEHAPPPTDLTPEEQAELDAEQEEENYVFESGPDELGDPYEEPDQTGFLPSVEFIVDRLDTATGVLLVIYFEGTDSFVVRANNGQLVFEEYSGSTMVDSRAASGSDWAHGVVVFDQTTTFVYLSGQLVATMTPSTRTGFETIRMLGDGTDPFTGTIGPIILYDTPLDERTIVEHYNVAYTGMSALKFIDTGAVTVMRDDDFRTFQYDWTIVPA